MYVVYERREGTKLRLKENYERRIINFLSQQFDVLAFREG